MKNIILILCVLMLTACAEWKTPRPKFNVGDTVMLKGMPSEAYSVRSVYCPQYKEGRRPKKCEYSLLNSMLQVSETWIKEAMLEEAIFVENDN